MVYYDKKLKKMSLLILMLRKK